MTRDPRTESIYAGVREDTSVLVTDERRFMVAIRPHLYAPAIHPGSRCTWCGEPRVHRVHPEESPRG